MQRQVIHSIAVAVVAALFVLGGLGAATAWAQAGPGAGQAMACPAGGMMGSGMMGSGMMGGGMRMRGDATRHFIEEMIPHHEDAIVMADLALVQAEHPELRELAATIKRVQTAEIVQMRQWYQAWYGETAPSGPGMMRGTGDRVDRVAPSAPLTPPGHGAGMMPGGMTGRGMMGRGMTGR